jgi:uncharacterized membrane protein YkoI
MRRILNIGVGVSTAAIAATMAAGVASATTGRQQQAAGSVAAGRQQQAAGSVAAASVNRHITKAQARQIARAKVPHSRVIEVQSDDLHDRAVWKVKLATSHGRVVVDVDKRTGKATIIRHGGGGGHDDAIMASPIASASWGREAGDDRGASAVADHNGRDVRDHDGAREERGERHHHRGDRHDHDRGDDGPGR